MLKLLLIAHKKVHEIIFVKRFCAALLILTMLVVTPLHASQVTPNEEAFVDRVQLITEQINLLKNRLSQAENELGSLKQEEQISQLALEKASKNLLDKAALDISVSNSNLDSINIELADSQQNSIWLEKNIQELENQLNVLNIFGLKIAPKEVANIHGYHSDLNYQKQLLQLEKQRIKYLQDLQNIANSILVQKKDKYNYINNQLNSRKLLYVKQQQVKDELAFQQQQNHWLEQLNVLYARLAKINPVESKPAYAAVERDIFYANENANFAYIQSLIARYKDQVQQMKGTFLKSKSISILYEISNQVQTLTKQINRLDTVLKSRAEVLSKHINYLAKRRKNNDEFQVYLKKLSTLENSYKNSDTALIKLNDDIATFRKNLDQALQQELSARQGFPTFGLKMLLDLGKEMLLIPALTFHVLKSLYSHFISAFKGAGAFTWSIFAVLQLALIFVFSLIHKLVAHLEERPSQWRDQINSKWLSLQCLRRNFISLVGISNIIFMMYYFNVPQQNLLFVLYLSFVWICFKCIMTILRVCLVETTHDTAGRDVKLFRRLRWIIIIGAIITAFTVFIHQLPLLYELKMLCDRLFLFLLMIVSLLLLRSYDILPNLILSHMESQHPYLQKSIRLFGVIVPILLFCNSVIGLLGFVNLIMTVSWYEGIFLIVLVGYLILRGILSDAMEQLSRMMIQYANNGWLWTEAFLKPLDTVLRITLFVTAWTVLFLLYGWDKQSPMFERLTGLLHYQLVFMLNTAITPLSIIELLVVISVFYWTANWTREFVFRMLLSRTKDMGLRNSIAILTQYSVVILGAFICLRVLGFDLHALTFVASAFAFGIGLGLRDLANNFASGFLLLLERPLRVGDIVNIGGFEGKVTHIGSRAVTIRTWDHTELMVPNAEIFNKSFTNWTAKDNVVRSIAHIKISRYDNPHHVKLIIQNILAVHNEILKDPMPEVYLRDISDTLMEFELRYYVNIRQVKSRLSVMSVVLMDIWDSFAQHGIKPPYPQHEVHLKGDLKNVIADTMGQIGESEGHA